MFEIATWIQTDTDPRDSHEITYSLLLIEFVGGKHSDSLTDPFKLPQIILASLLKSLTYDLP